MLSTALRSASALTLAAVAVGWSAAEADTVDDLALRRVMLSTGGVGYFEYEARVDGAVDLSIDVRLDQVNDVLKSIVVYDDQGGIGEISLPGQAPLVDVFRELPFDRAALSSPVDLLNALTGHEVLAEGPRRVTGRVIAVEPVAEATESGGLITRHRLSLLTDDGMRQLILEDAETVRFTDEALQASIDEALSALAEHTRREGRALSISLDGDQERTVRVAYVVSAPLWKSSYRLTLPADADAETAALQGWAVLENFSGEHWEDVDLTVVSGNPVTFRQALYAAYYVDRPEVPVEVLGRVLPPLDEGGVAMMEAEELARRGGMPAGIADMGVEGVALASEPMPASLPGAPQTPAQLHAAAGTEATTQVIFRVPQPVDVADGHTLLVPIIDRTVPVERLSVFRADTHSTHPLAAIRLDNDGETGLPPGVLTLYESDAAAGLVSFVGDARLDAVPRDDSRLISFAVDQSVTIDMNRRDTSRTSRASIVDGVMERITTESARTVYTIENVADQDRTVLIEHPRSPGWTLVEPPEGEVAELTATHFRLPVTVPAGETVQLEVVMQRPRGEEIVLADVGPRQIRIYAEDTSLPAEIRTEMQRLSEFLADVETKQRALDRLLDAENSITRDQERIRRNLDSVPEDSDLHARYLDTLGQQEDELESLDGDIDLAEQALDDAYLALRDYAGSLVVRPAE